MSVVGTPKSAEQIQQEWDTNPRWKDVTRTYSAEDVVALQGSVVEEHTLARRGAEVLWEQLHDLEWVNALGALTGNMAVQQVRAGLKAIYLSGWQVAGDANLSGHTYPDQSLYPANSVPQVVRRINNALQRADQIAKIEGDTSVENWLAPIVADGEAGFGGALNVYELQKALIAAGVAGSHWEDQLASEKKCGHLGGKVLIPTPHLHIRTLTSARLAADVADVPTVVIARTDAEAATLITSDVDERDQPFITGERTREGFYRTKNGIEPCIARAKAYAPFADLIWMETGTPDLEAARQFSEAVKAEYPDQMLAYNCSPSFNWKKHLDDATIAKFQKELAAMGFKFQFITLAGFHALNYSMFDLAYGYAQNQMSAYVELQEREFAAEERGYTATKHQREGRRRLLRPDCHHRGPEFVDHRVDRFHRRGPVPLVCRADAKAPFCGAKVALLRLLAHLRRNSERCDPAGRGCRGRADGVRHRRGLGTRAGVEVTVFEPAEALITAGRNRIVKSLERAVSAGKVTERERDRALGLLTFTTDLNDLSDRQLVIEAVVEDEAVKSEIFAELDRVVTDPDAVLASNTSSIPIMKVAAATKQPQRVLGLHFFNPVPVLPLVELVRTLVTDEAAAARTEEFASTVLGKQVVRCSDRSGFVVNALLVPYLLSAIRMVEAGFATVEDVDKAVVAGLSHPMGPLRLSDLVGLDTLKLIADKMFEEFKEPHYGPPPLLLRMVEAGQLGKKSGRGFYTY
ncbi:isocitrate lyase [Mycobacterium tuberculosis RGTB423]|nr:isocitrate lyase [Mycobacterium tuberculosis RGTB423]